MLEYVPVAVKLGEAVIKLGKYFADVKAGLEIEDDVENLYNELQIMKAFLSDADNNPGNRDSYVFQEWVREVGELIDKCNDVVNQLAKTTLHTSWLRSHIFYPIVLYRTHKLGKLIKSVLQKSLGITQRQQRFNLNVGDGTTIDAETKQDKKIRAQSYAIVENGVELADTFDDVNEKLTDGSSGHFLILILGMGGLGKTTLARKLYKTSSGNYFKFRAWICVVSIKYEIQDLLKELINLLIPANERDLEGLTSIELMKQYLRNYLSNPARRYLVVLDHLCNEEDWDSLMNAFPDIKNGSRVIITTRNMDAVPSNNAWRYNLRFLNDVESWELFRKRTLPTNTECPPNMEEIGKEIVANCSGLPLAIVTVGKKLASKPLLASVWRSVRNNPREEFGNYHEFDAILKVGFKDLPKHLQQCFLYVAMFPEDLAIKRSRLMLLWEAEEFIKNDERKYIGDATKAYFEELVTRSLFPKIGGDWIDSTFRVHDLLRNLAIKMARKNKFSICYDGNDDFSEAQTATRLVVFCSDDEKLREYNNIFLHTLRSGVIPGNAQGPSTSSQPQPQPQPPFRETLQAIHYKFRRLRVLDVQISTISSCIPNAIGKLIFLKFLAFQSKQSSDEYMLPDTLGKLKVLQTLSIPLGLVKLPKTVLKLTQVKHFIGNFIFLSDKIGSFASLETLAGISGEQWCRLDTTNLVNIRRLKLWSIKNVQQRFYDNFRNLGKLKTLTLHQDSVANSDISLERIFELCPSVSHLETFGISFSNSLNLDTVAKNLEVIEWELNGSQTEINNSISSIGKLSSLEALHILLPGQDGTEVVCITEDFPQLRSLKITSSQYLITVMEGCMLLVEHLEVNKRLIFNGPARLMQLLKVY